MDPKQLVRDRLPLALQDRLREVVDLVVPARRRAIASKSLSHSEAVALAKRVSPSGSVLDGPFQGLRLPLGTSSGSTAPYLAGSYEEELNPHVEAAIAAKPSTVVDVGAGEGYYAVGLAKRLPDARVVAFDIDAAARKLCRQTAEMNKTPNVAVRGRVTPSALEKVLGPGALVVCDCEGYEQDLLDPAAAPSLRTASMIVELHDLLAPGVTEIFRGRFGATHQIQLIPFREREFADRPHLDHLSTAEKQAAMAEGRPIDPWPMHWAIATPR